MAKKKPRVKVKVDVSSCFMICSQAMPCPLCGVSVPAWTQHNCSKKYEN